MYHNRHNKLFLLNILLILIPHVIFSQNTTDESLDTPSIYFTNQYMNLDNINYTINWNTLDVITNIHYSWTPSSNEQYFNPSRAFALTESYTNTIFSELTKYILVRNQESLLDFTRNYSLYQNVLSHIISNSAIIAQIPDSSLFGTTIQYHTPLLPLIHNIIYPTLQTLNLPYIAYSAKHTIEYTSIIISVNNPIPTQLQKNKKIIYTPKILPRVYDIDTGILVFTPEYFNPKSEVNNRAYIYIFQEDYPSSPTGINPLFIIPKAINFDPDGDILISAEDTRKILSSDHNRNLILEGKVIFIINPSQSITVQ